MRYLFLVTMLMGLAFASRVESHEDVTWNHTHFWLSEAAYDDLDHDSIRWTGGHNHDGDGVKHGHPNDPEHGGNGTASKAHLMGSHGAVLKNAPAPEKKDPAPVKPVKNNPAPAPAPGGGGGVTSEDNSNDNSDDDSVASTPYTPAPTPEPEPVVVVPLTNILRISYLSFEVVEGRGRIRNFPTLTIEITAYAPDTVHNGLVITVNGQTFPTPYQFFGADLMTTDDTRRFALSAHPRNDAVLLKLLSSKKTHWLGGSSWKTIRDFDIDRFTVSIGSDTVTQTNFDSDGNRLGSFGASPSLRRPKLTTMWANLKQRR